MNVVFWVLVVLAAFIIWKSLCKHFFKIGGDFTEMIDDIKNGIKKEDNEE